jgi:hypothetical protein
MIATNAACKEPAQVGPHSDMGGGIGHGCQLVSKQPLPGVIRIPSQRPKGPIGSPLSVPVRLYWAPAPTRGATSAQ